MDVELEAVGRRIGELRRSAGLRLADLADSTGYTTSYVSQIERGSTLPSLTALATLAIALGVEMTTLLDGFAEPSVTITRATTGLELRLPDGRWYRLLGPLGDEHPFTAMTQQIPREPQSFRHYGERFILVLSGSMQLRFGQATHEIGPLGTIHYGAHEEHSGEAASDEASEMLIISCPGLL